MTEMRPGLSIPLSQVQIDTANQLYSRLRQWPLTDDTLAALAAAFPNWEPEAALLKVSAVNQLYGTNLYAVDRMARHVGAIMATADPASEGPALVERIAALPSLPTQQTQWRHFSFASKLAHFFMNAELFPIYDSYVVQMVKFHLGYGRYQHDAAHPYQAFITNLQRLREYADLSCTGREPDRYLWLAGEYRNWRKNVGQASINAELRQLFTAPSASVQANLDALLPSLQGVTRRAVADSIQSPAGD